MRRLLAPLAAGALFSACATAPPRPAPPPPPERAAADALLRRVSIDDGGDPQVGAFLRAAVLQTLRSPTARRLALEYSKEGLPARLSVFTVPGSKMGNFNGSPYLTIKAAETFVDQASTISVRLNDLMLKATDQAPNSVAHELLGHALDWSRAIKDGSSPAYEYADSSELNAKLVGWIVDQELGDRGDQNQIEDFFADTTTYMDRHRFDAPSHCLGLSRAEMGDALAAHKKRLAQLESDRAYFNDRLPSARNELGWIAHFIDVHGMRPAAFAQLKADLRREVDVEIPGELAVRKASERALQERIKLFRKKKNRKILAEVAKDPLIAAWDARTAELTEILRRVYRPVEANPFSQPKPRPGTIDRAKLKEMIDVDRLGCPFAGR